MKLYAIFKGEFGDFLQSDLKTERGYLKRAKLIVSHGKLKHVDFIKCDRAHFYSTDPYKRILL